MEYTILNNGVKMPMEGFGVYQVSDLEECQKVVEEAIDAEYRLIDTAAAYGNEEAVGNAIRNKIEEGVIKREDIFVTSKLWVSDFSYEKALEGFERSRQKLGLEYIDLYLLHQAYGDIYGAWRALEEVYEKELVRAIGVSNFFPFKFVEFAELVETIPAVNQIELHPFFSQEFSIETMRQYGCVPQAWGPLAEGQHDIFIHPLLKKIGDKYGKTPAQVALRWNIDRGVCILPKSVHKDRIIQNIDIWDFNLTKEEIEEINTLTLDHSTIINHFDNAIVKMIVNL